MLGKRDLKSRQGEIRTSVIGTVGRVAQNVQFDTNETLNRSKKKQYKRTLMVVPPAFTDIQTRTVACVIETEPAMYYKPNVPTDRKLVGNLGRQGFVWTSINGLGIEAPSTITKTQFDDFPFEVKHEFIMKSLEFRGLITTSWQHDSKLAEVTHNKFPVTKQGTAMIHPMYPTTIIAGDTLTVSFPSPTDIQKKVATPNRDDDKLLMAVKPLREVLAVNHAALEKVLTMAEQLWNLVPVGVAVGGAAIAIAKANGLDDFRKNLTYVNDGFKHYILQIMTIKRNELQKLNETTTPFKILYYATLAASDDGRPNDIPMASTFVAIRNAARGYAGICEAMYDQQQLMNATRLGLALTSATQGQPCDVIVGR